LLYLLAAARLLLVAPYLAREAVASSRIEGTQASLSDVFEADATYAVPNADLEEVRNYIAAVEHGIARLPDLPLSMRLLRECHGVLVSGGRGAEKTPGELRQSQNWIGAASATIAELGRDRRVRRGGPPDRPVRTPVQAGTRALLDRSRQADSLDADPLGSAASGLCGNSRDS